MTDDILIKYITGQCTEEEKSEVLAWLKEDIDHTDSSNWSRYGD